MSKLVNELPFGATLAEKMLPGVLVSWSEWMITDNDLIEVIYYGTIVNKSIKIEGNRPIIVIKVACSDSGEILSLNPFQLRIEETN